MPRRYNMGYVVSLVVKVLDEKMEVSYLELAAILGVAPSTASQYLRLACLELARRGMRVKHEAGVCREELDLSRPAEDKG